MVISYNRLLCLLRAEILYLIFKPFIDIYVLQELWLFRMFKNKTKSNDILVIRCIDKCHKNLQGYIRLWRFHTKLCCMVLLLKKKLSKSFVLIKLIECVAVKHCFIIGSNARLWNHGICILIFFIDFGYAIFIFQVSGFG